MKFNTSNCDFCQSKRLSKLYQVPDSKLSATVYICNNCGLVQSLFNNKIVKKERVISASSGADWGNIRHGKKLRFENNLAYFIEYFKGNKFKEILDIGSNRGDFLLWVSNNYPNIRLTGIEPDKKVIDSYKRLKNLRLYLSRFENVRLPSDKFDFIYCSQTLEHAKSASEMLKKIYSISKDGAYIFIEVPNIEVIKDDDVVEEFFIDKHTFHFNRFLLIEYIKSLGFQIIKGEKLTDTSNIALVIKKSDRVDGNYLFNKTSSLVIYNKKLIKKYNITLSLNRKNLKVLVKNLEEFIARQKVVFWGGGRIFDSLVVYGGLKTDHILGVIDKYLRNIIPVVHGVPLKGPEYLRTLSPDVVIILAKSSADEIEKEVRSYGVRHVIKFRDILNNF